MGCRHSHQHMLALTSPQLVKLPTTPPYAKTAPTDITCAHRLGGQNKPFLLVIA